MQDKPSWEELYRAGHTPTQAAKLRGGSKAAALKWAQRYALSWSVSRDVRNLDMDRMGRPKRRIRLPYSIQPKAGARI
jgi:hypothetical protein